MKYQCPTEQCPFEVDTERDAENPMWQCDVCGSIFDAFKHGAKCPTCRHDFTLEGTECPVCRKTYLITMYRGG
jgi:hypothetical protein